MGLPEDFEKLDTPSRLEVLTTLKGNVPAEIFESTITKDIGQYSRYANHSGAKW